MQIASSGGRRLRHAALAARKLALEAERTVTRKELSAAARDAEKVLMLRPAQRLVLSELVACWGEQEWDKLLVWPSNDHLVSRTGLNNRSIRRILGQLTDLKLIVAKGFSRIPLYERDIATTAVPLRVATTLYTRVGDWLAYLGLLGTAGALMARGLSGARA